MTIPTADMAVITGAQADLLAIKTACASLMARAFTMYDLKTASPLALVACMEARARAQNIYSLASLMHADMSRALIVEYGMADAGAVIMGGGGGRR